jgi:hypothetical protein
MSADANRARSEAMARVRAERAAREARIANARDPEVHREWSEARYARRKVAQANADLTLHAGIYYPAYAPTVPLGVPENHMRDVRVTPAWTGTKIPRARRTRTRTEIVTRVETDRALQRDVIGNADPNAAEGEYPPPTGGTRDVAPYIRDPGTTNEGR